MKAKFYKGFSTDECFVLSAKEAELELKAAPKDILSEDEINDIVSGVVSGKLERRPSVPLGM